ncbi:hypothetical protein [Streptomonospora arabica]|uniref:SDR family NAD(P)-dependent oxidoreductase n=1 Tax=Streptomonospora arabica TaxID=412417 RepID=A0ABV9SHR0_9ACTN
MAGSGSRGAAVDRCAAEPGNPEPLGKAVSDLGGAGTAVGVAGKAHDAEHRDEVVRRTLAEFGCIDVLVNNTGTNPVFDAIVNADPAAMAKIRRAAEPGRCAVPDPKSILRVKRAFPLRRHPGSADVDNVVVGHAHPGRVA